MCKGVRGAAMQCLACRADNKMLLVEVVRDDSIKEPVIERRIYMCSECRHFARRLAFRRTTMPITLPTISTPPRRASECAHCVPKRLGESGRDSPQQTNRLQRESSSREDR
jgi:hypothetical protein